MWYEERFFYLTTHKCFERREFQCEISFHFHLQFQLGPLEFLTGISGSAGPYCGLENVITSLSFVTNARSYGPFGGGYGKPFHIQVQSDGCWIVGFFGRSNKYLYALGVYTNQEVLQHTSFTRVHQSKAFY